MPRSTVNALSATSISSATGHVHQNGAALCPGLDEEPSASGTQSCLRAGRGLGLCAGGIDRAAAARQFLADAIGGGRNFLS
jgi:hypothetical protein